MSCSKCEKEPIKGAYYRWRNANIEIVACKRHWFEIREVLNEAQRTDDTQETDNPHDNLINDVKNLLNDVENYEFHDFRNSAYAMPKVALITRLEALIEKTKEGKYDNME